MVPSDTHAFSPLSYRSALNFTIDEELQQLQQQAATTAATAGCKSATASFHRELKLLLII
jgi:hypothetical protein